MSQEFLSASLDITKDFHIWPATTTNRKQLNTSHLLLMVISLAQTLLSRAKFRQLRVIKKDIILLTLDWLWGRPQALLQRRNVSSVHVGLANGTKRTPSQNWGTLLSEMHVPLQQCLNGISNTFSASFTSIWPSFPRFYCAPNKACLLCTTLAVPWISEDCLLASGTNCAGHVLASLWLEPLVS